MSNTVAITLIIVGVVGVCGSGLLLVVLTVVWWFVSRRESPVTVYVHLDEEELEPFKDYDTGRSHVATYELFDERVELTPEKPVPQVLRIRPRPGLIARALPPEETVSDPETDSPLACGENEA